MMSILDARLAATQAFVAGADFTLADIPIGLSVNRWLMTAIERPALLRAPVAEPQLDAREALRGNIHWRSYQRVKP